MLGQGAPVALLGVALANGGLDPALDFLHILQDEKIPGVHIAFGHPYAEHTGANWISKTHIDCVGRDFDIWFDDEQVMQGGKFLV